MSTQVSEAWALLPDYLGQHVLLSVSAILLGIAISLPLAILAAGRPSLRGPLLTFASIVQTIPGLALLALFYPLLLGLSLLTLPALGIAIPALGFLPALMALTLYSMLPVLRNTITALTGIDPALLTAARGVGMTERQSLLLVELPLAAPVIMAGIRTAAVLVVGTATLSTPVGQTSLGNYIFTGLQTENWVFVLFGCVAAAVLALVLDQLLALAGNGMARRAPGRILMAAVGLVLVIGLSLAATVTHAQRGIVIGAKNFQEQYILADLIQRRLAGAGIAARVKSDLGSAMAFRALQGGGVDVYVDYTGTLWGNEMRRSDMPGRKAMLDQLGAWMGREKGVTLVGSLGFENAYVLAMRADRAAALHIETLDDLAAHASELAIGGDFEIFSRPEWRGVAAAYGFQFARRQQFQPDFLYRAVADGTVDVITAFSSDGRIARYGLKLLADPKGALPPYDAVLLARTNADPRLLAALKPLLGAISLPRMQAANLQVDRTDNKQTPAQAAAWLDAQLAPP